MEKMSIKQALLDLIHVDVQLPAVSKDYPDLKPIIDFISEGDFLSDDDKPWPTIKDISKKTNIRYDRVRKMILELYELMFPYMECKYLNFTNVKYQLYFSYFEKRHFMVLDNLPIVPRIGENVTLPFLKAILEIERFYISSIRHRFERDIQLVEIELKGGDYNLFWHNRKDEAKEKREIPWMDFYEKDDCMIKEEILAKDMEPKYSSYGILSKENRRWNH